MKLFPLHILPNDTKIDFMRPSRPILVLMLLLLIGSITEAIECNVWSGATSSAAALICR